MLGALFRRRCTLRLVFLVLLALACTAWTAGTAPSPECWAGPFSFEVCCLPVPNVNPQCFNDEFTPERCCGDEDFGMSVGGCSWSGDGPSPAYHDLGRFFDKHGTDKGNARHLYHKLYSSALEGYRHSSKLVVEIGIGTLALMGYPAGQGLRAWRDYFPNAQIVGLDIDPAATILGEERILTIAPVDTTQPWSVEAELAGSVQAGSVDVIVDDGAHDPVLQGKTLTSLWGFLRDGGLYFIEDLEYKYGEGRTPKSLEYLGPRATHHFCAMEVTRPFVFGSLHAKDAIQGLAIKPEETNYTPPGLDRILESNGAFYVALKIDHEISNIMALPKNWPQEDLVFGHIPGSYRMVYNVLLHGAQPRVVVTQEPSQAILWRSAFPGADVREGPVSQGCNVDVLVTSAGSPRLVELLRDFGRLRRGGLLFIEDVSFSFCHGSPDPAFILPPIRGIVAANPDWFFAMAQSEWPHDSIPDMKLLVIRRA